MPWIALRKHLTHGTVTSQLRTSSTSTLSNLCEVPGCMGRFVHTALMNEHTRRGPGPPQRSTSVSVWRGNGVVGCVWLVVIASRRWNRPPLPASVSRRRPVWGALCGNTVYWAWKDRVHIYVKINKSKIIPIELSWRPMRLYISAG